ncbi:hypothetical protein DACRYDRAFT_115756 [Dacryopinax primogenitus]|uniref:Novel STAND NTPase 1 domain-containing protein n=1 Tax=Dacryopinax primogenitus (strain DJM 731) TaxID=1858805 RepID=M5FXM1_DACPD|nr:uncharacterized protein DACRYDRAFT_115756 [Dacryopinax primogenitus]EJU02771.1 hypothetical protein DACRYDRAFT_115756 [Dacryopinax primogenitus]
MTRGLDHLRAIVEIRGPTSMSTQFLCSRWDITQHVLNIPLTPRLFDSGYYPANQTISTTPLLTSSTFVVSFMSTSKVPFQETWERWTTRATSQLAPIKEKLRNTATQVAGIADTFQELEDDSRQLALKVTWVTQVILERIPPDGPADERAKEVVLALATKVFEIDAFLRSGTKKGDMTGKRAKKVSKYHKSLDTLRLQCVEIHTDVSNNASGRSLGQQGPSLIDIPPTPEAFYGRDEVVGSIVQLLLQDKPCRVPVLGPGGVGKTSVAAAAMNDEQVKERYGEHIYFLICEGIDSEEGLVNALAVFFKLERDSNTRTALIAHLSSLGRALLTLDNFETTTQSDRQRIRELLGRIGRVPSLSLIITMRGTQPAQGLTWDTMPPLQKLPLHASRQIWKQVSNKSDEKLDELLERLDGLPLAIHLMALQRIDLPPSTLLAAYEREASIWSSPTELDDWTA